jgi:hypothetical protein
MICLYLQGWATLEELIAHVEKLKTKSRDPPAPGCERRPRDDSLRLEPHR